METLHIISIPNDFRHPRHLDPWPSDHCLLNRPLSCRAWDCGGWAELQGRRLFNRLEMAACLRTPSSQPPPPAADWCTPLCLGRTGAGLLSGTCPGEHPLPAFKQTDRLCMTFGQQFSYIDEIMTANEGSNLVRVLLFSRCSCFIVKPMHVTFRWLAVKRFGELFTPFKRQNLHTSQNKTSISKINLQLWLKILMIAAEIYSSRI